MDGADSHAETAAVARRSDLGGAGNLVEADARVTGIHASTLASAAADADVEIDVADDLDRRVEVLEGNDLVSNAANDFLELGVLALSGFSAWADILLDDDGLGRKRSNESLFDFSSINLTLIRTEALLGSKKAVVGVEEVAELLEVRTGARVEEELETRDALVDEELLSLVHGSRAELDSRGTSLHELPGRESALSTTGSEDGEVRESLVDGDGAHEGEGSDGTAGDATEGNNGVLTLTDFGDEATLGGDVVDTGHGIDAGDTSSTTFLGSAGELDDITLEVTDLGEERNAHSSVNSLDGLLDDLGVRLGTLLAKVGAGDVELEGINTGGSDALGEGSPGGGITLAVDGGNEDVVGELFLELLELDFPVGGLSLRVQLDVGVVVGEGVTSNTGADVGEEILIGLEGLGNNPAEASLEGSADHESAFSGRTRGETEGVGELETSDGNRGVDEIDGGHELRDGGGLGREFLVADELGEVSVHVPGSELTIVNTFDDGGGANAVTTSEDALNTDAGTSLTDDIEDPLAVELDRGEDLLTDVAAEGSDEVVELDGVFLIAILLVGLSAGDLSHELADNSDSLAVLDDDLLGGVAAELLDLLTLETSGLVVVHTHIDDTTTEDEGDEVSTAAEGSLAAVSSDITSTKNSNTALEVGELNLLRDHAGLGGSADLLEEVLAGVDVGEAKGGAEGLDSGGFRDTNTNEDGLIAVLLEGVNGEVLAEGLVEDELDAEVFNELDFESGSVVGHTELGDFNGGCATSVGLLFEDSDILVSPTSKIGSAGKRSRTGTNESNLGIVLRLFLDVRVSDLRELHAHESFSNSSVEVVNVDGSMEGIVKNASTTAVVGSGAKVTTGPAERVVGEESLSCSINISLRKRMVE